MLDAAVSRGGDFGCGAAISGVLADAVSIADLIGEQDAGIAVTFIHEGWPKVCYRAPCGGPGWSGWAARRRWFGDDFWSGNHLEDAQNPGLERLFKPSGTNDAHRRWCCRSSAAHRQNPHHRQGIGASHPRPRS